MRIILMLLIAVMLSSCEFLNDTDPYGNPYPNQYPGYSNPYPNYPPPNYPPPNYPYGGYNNPYPQNHYPYPQRRPRYDDRHDHHDDRHDRPTRPERPNKPNNTIDSSIKPSCPSGTTFNGSHCIIHDNSLKRKGGDGRINPCPKGMWVSGGKCVGG